MSAARAQDRSGRRGEIDDVIDPADTCAVLIDVLSRAGSGT
jgi:hypothetical protein